MIIRILDCIFSVIGLILLFPILVFLSVLILISSSGGVFFIQDRIGKEGIPFKLIKFRSMLIDSESTSLLTIGNDRRLTPIGKILRKYKLDEIPQLINVIKGEMSIVGPRPEVKKFVDLYTKEQQLVLSVRPGLTDYASIEFFNENELLSDSDNPEQTYISEIMPRKIKLNMIFIDNPSVRNYLKIILLTIKSLFKQQINV